MATKLINAGLAVARNPAHTRWLCPVLLLADVILTMLIIRKISCAAPQILQETRS